MEYLSIPNTICYRKFDFLIIFVYDFNMGMVYFVRGDGKGPVKVGFTTNLMGRLATMQTANSQELLVFKTIRGSQKIEKAIKEKLKVFNIRGEWFKDHPQVIKFIKDLITDSNKAQLEFINNYKFEIANGEITPEVTESVRITTIKERLEKAKYKARNSGFVEGIMFAQAVIENVG